ncbi:MAG TPA: hypothetical protein VGM74_11650 [Burkholderiaceae bacterium]|jgi:hypothetical protein
MKLEHAVSKPRATAEAVRDTHVKPTARTRRVVGDAAQRTMPSADAEAESNDGGDWFAERVADPGADTAKKGSP